MNYICRSFFRCNAISQRLSGFKNDHWGQADVFIVKTIIGDRPKKRSLGQADVFIVANIAGMQKQGCRNRMQKQGGCRNRDTHNQLWAFGDRKPSSMNYRRCGTDFEMERESNAIFQTTLGVQNGKTLKASAQSGAVDELASIKRMGLRRPSG